MTDAIVIAQLNARMQPLDRGDYFEDPLDEKLQELGIGEVTGGGTQLTDEPDGILYCDIEIALKDLHSTNLKSVIEILENLGAPKGSVLKVEGRPDISFGQREGMGVFLNGTDLADEVYASSDVNEVIENLNKCMTPRGAFMGYWEGSAETSLFIVKTSKKITKTIIPIKYLFI